MLARRQRDVEIIQLDRQQKTRHHVLWQLWLADAGLLANLCQKVHGQMDGSLSDTNRVNTSCCHELVEVNYLSRSLGAEAAHGHSLLIVHHQLQPVEQVDFWVDGRAPLFIHLDRESRSLKSLDLTFLDW